MTRPRFDNMLDRVYTQLPGDECAVAITRLPIELVKTAPLDRGELGRVLVRDETGIRETWWLRCPWCREMIDLDERRIHMQAGRLTVEGGVSCGRCDVRFDVRHGVARRRVNQDGRP